MSYIYIAKLATKIPQSAWCKTDLPKYAIRAFSW